MKAQVISFHCVLKNSLGQVISTTFNRDVITQAPQSEPDSLPGLAKGLGEVTRGERRRIFLKAAEAYGLYDRALTREGSRHSLELHGKLSLGDRVHLQDTHGKFWLYRVTGITGDTVFLDANHPLAGQDLIFDIDVLEARDATPEELRESDAPASSEFLH